MKKGISRGHQGDVQFRVVDAVPEGFRPSKDRNIAYGEVSGHVHVVTGTAEIYRKSDSDQICAVVGPEGATLQHTLLDKLTSEVLASPQEAVRADHHPVQLPKGIYVFAIQQRYNPYSKLFEKVQD